MDEYAEPKGTLTIVREANGFRVIRTPGEPAFVFESLHGLVVFLTRVSDLYPIPDEPPDQSKLALEAIAWTNKVLREECELRQNRINALEENERKRREGRRRGWR